MTAQSNEERIDFRAIVAGLPGLFVVMDKDLKIVEVSDAYNVATMTRRQNMLGKTMLEVFPDNPEDPTADGEHNLRTSLEHVLKSGLPDTMAVQKYDIRKPPEEGGGYEERYWTPINSPILGPNGQVRYIVHQAQDVTEFMRLKQHETEQSKHNEGLSQRTIQMQAEILERTREVASASAQLKTSNRALEAARIKAEAANLAKSAFLATMSHEIRTPMNGVLGMASLLRRTQLDAKQRDFLDKIQTSGEHLLAIIDDILDFSKIEAGKIQLSIHDFVLQDLLSETWTLVGERARAKELEQKTLCARPELILRGDKTRLMQALVNFMGNAVKFTACGGVTLGCHVLEESSQGYLLRFEVTDTGIGMTEEQQGRVFDAFEQADSSISRRYQGTGLGLAITKRIAELMDGETGVHSVPGQGSTFWMTCRLAKGKDARPLLRTGVETAETILTRDYTGRRVLVIDDEPINREIMVALLEDTGLIIEEAENGKEAVSMLQQGGHDIVLMDMQMPELDGLGATKALRATPGLEKLVIIAMTANAFDDDRLRCLSAGMNDFIAKPFRPACVFEKLVYWFGHLDR